MTTPLLVFLHGFPNTPRLWERQLERFAGSCQTHCLSLSALAVTAEGTVDFGFDGLVERLGAAVRSLRGQAPESPVYLVGHDLACFLIDALSRQAPGLVTRQFLINGTGLAPFVARLSSPPQLARSFYVWLLNLPLVPWIVQRRLTSLVTALIYARASVDKASPLRTAAYNDFAPIGVYRALSRRAVAMLWRGDLARTPPSPVPTTLVTAADDPFLTQPSEQELTRFYAQATLRRLASSHWSPLTHASAINHILAAGIAGEVRA